MKTACKGKPHDFLSFIVLSMIPLALLPAAGIRIDGDFQDWKDVKVLARDPKGDAKGAFDVTQVFAVSQGSTLYLRFDVGTVLNLQNGPKAEGTLFILIGLPNGQQLRLDTRRRLAYLNDNSEERIPWPHLKYVVGPTYAQDEFEVQIDLSGFAVGLGDSVSIQFDGSDRLDAPVVHTFSQSSPKPKHRSSDRLPGTDVRIVSFNTYVEGLCDPNRATTIGRLLNAVDGDIYCFQEEWESSDIDKIMNRLTLLDSLGQRYIHKVRGNVITSKHPLKVLPSGNSHYAAALLNYAGKSMVVMSVHLSAMGYIGSREDLWRIEQTRVILDAIEEINKGTYHDPDGPSTKPSIVMIGDFNLVGSRTPVDLLINQKSSGLNDWLLPNLVGESIITWRGGLRSSFSPGKLDYCLYTSETLTRKNGFMLNSELLDQTELKQLELRSTDSRVSDHLIMVVDFQFSS